MRAGVIAAAMVLPWYALAFAQTPSDLVRSLDKTQLKTLVADAGLQVAAEDRGGMYVSDGKSWPMLVTLLACEDNGSCAYLRTRTRYGIAKSKAAREAADFYDLTVPIAFVAVFESQKDGSAVAEVGRDVFIAPGRTRANLVAELKFSIQMADIFRKSLMESDPAIAEKLR